MEKDMKKDKRWIKYPEGVLRFALFVSVDFYCCREGKAEGERGKKDLKEDIELLEECKYHPNSGYPHLNDVDKNMIDILINSMKEAINEN